MVQLQLTKSQRRNRQRRLKEKEKKSKSRTILMAQPTATMRIDSPESESTHHSGPVNQPTVTSIPLTASHKPVVIPQEPQGQSTQTRATSDSRGVGLVVETGSTDSMDQEVTTEEAIIAKIGSRLW